jgi:predicted DNA-binding protein
MSDSETRTLKDQFMLRLPDGMRDRIKAVAEQSGRSMNAEIVKTLDVAYPEPKDTMYLVLDDIRRVLEDYEKETDPKRRLWLQTTVEGLASGSMTIDWYDKDKE